MCGKRHTSTSLSLSCEMFKELQAREIGFGDVAGRLRQLAPHLGLERRVVEAHFVALRAILGLFLRRRLGFFFFAFGDGRRRRVASALPPRFLPAEAAAGLRIPREPVERARRRARGVVRVSRPPVYQSFARAKARNRTLHASSVPSHAPTPTGQCERGWGPVSGVWGVAPAWEAGETGAGCLQEAADAERLTLIRKQKSRFNPARRSAARPFGGGPSGSARDIRWRARAPGRFRRLATSTRLLAPRRLARSNRPYGRARAKAAAASRGRPSWSSNTRPSVNAASGARESPA